MILSQAATAAARDRFAAAAHTHAITAYRDHVAAQAVADAIASLPTATVAVLGGASGIEEILRQRAKGSVDSVSTPKASVVETFTVTLPLHSMSPDFLISDEKYRSSCGRKLEKGERFRMLFEDGKHYNGTVVGCLDCMVRPEDLTSAGAALAPAAAGAGAGPRAQAALRTSVTSRFPEIGVPWESLLVRWDDGEKSVSRLNPWETLPLPGTRPSKFARS